jgi:hypothetical protein
MILEILVELLLMECGLRVLALFVSSRLLRVEISPRRLLALAGIILFAAIISDILGSEFLRGLARRLLEEAIQVVFLAAGIAWLAHVRLARSIAVAIVTSFLFGLLLIIIEAIWGLIVFGSST